MSQKRLGPEGRRRLEECGEGRRFRDERSVPIWPRPAPRESAHTARRPLSACFFFIFVGRRRPRPRPLAGGSRPRHHLASRHLGGSSASRRCVGRTWCSVSPASLVGPPPLPPTPPPDYFTSALRVSREVRHELTRSIVLFFVFLFFFCHTHKKNTAASRPANEHRQRRKSKHRLHRGAVAPVVLFSFLFFWFFGLDALDVWPSEGQPVWVFFFLSLSLSLATDGHSEVGGCATKATCPCLVIALTDAVLHLVGRRCAAFRAPTLSTLVSLAFLFACTRFTAKKLKKQQTRRFFWFPSFLHVSRNSLSLSLSLSLSI